MHVRLSIFSLVLATCLVGCATTPSTKGPPPLDLRSTRMSDDAIRIQLLAFADTATTRVNQLCDQVVREAERELSEFRKTDPPQDKLNAAIVANTRTRSRANIEKLSIANLCMENTANANLMSGLLDMTFAITIKARSADRRVMASTQPMRDDPFDPWAEEFAEVYKRCNDDIWEIAMSALTAEQVEGLAPMIDAYLDENPDLRYASAKAMDLQKYVTDGKRSAAFSLVDMKATNAQVDQLLWMGVRMPDILRLQAKQAMFDAAREISVLREDAVNDLEAAVDRIIHRVANERIAAIDNATIALNDARAKAVEDATSSAQLTVNDLIDRLVRRFVWWVLLPAGCVAMLFFALGIYAVRTVRLSLQRRNAKHV
jgi:hypothetical protein